MMSAKILELLNQIAILLPVLLVLFTFTGFMQALTAKLMGDRTAEHDGFLSLNPFTHLDIFGLIIVFFGYFVIGLITTNQLPNDLFFIILVSLGAKMIVPVPIEAKKFKNYKLGLLVTYLSGCLGSIVLAVGAILFARCLCFFSMPNYVIISIMDIVITIIKLAVLFGILNLIPLPPFNGWRVLQSIIPPSRQHIITWLEKYSLFIFLIIFAVPGINDSFFDVLSRICLTIKKLLLGYTDLL